MSSVSRGPEKIVFVGGTPRSGTTITHALLCTAPGANGYVPEASFFSFLIQAFWAGSENWDVHTSGLYPDRATFQRSIAAAATATLNDIWRHVGEPRILCLKDPLLTPWFPWTERLLPQASFVTVCRHPFEVVRSRQDGHEKGARTPFTRENAIDVARGYARDYSAVLAHSFGGRHMMFRYEDLNQERIRAALAQFVGAPGFDLERLWCTPDGGRRTSTSNSSDPSNSPKYGADIDLEPRLAPLNADWRADVEAICKSVMARMGYL